MWVSYRHANGKMTVHARQRGISLLIVIIMVLLIGVTTAATMRGVTSNEKVTNNVRMEGLAQQYAQAALVYCEGQLQMANAGRVPTLQDGSLSRVAVGGTPIWNTAASWRAGTANASLTTVPADRLGSGTGAFVPTTLPQCIAERQQVGTGTTDVFVVTARGFSPDYQVNSDGTTAAGSVVWLQSTLYLE